MFAQYMGLPIKHIDNSREIIKRHPELEDAVTYVIKRVHVNDDITIQSCDVYREQSHYGCLDDEGFGWKFHKGCHACDSDLEDYLRMDVSEILDSILELGDHRP